MKVLINRIHETVIFEDDESGITHCESVYEKRKVGRLCSEFGMGDRHFGTVWDRLLSFTPLMWDGDGLFVVQPEKPDYKKPITIEQDDSLEAIERDKLGEVLQRVDEVYDNLVSGVAKTNEGEVK